MSIKGFVRDLLARGIVVVLRRLAYDPKYFELWQANGFHVVPVHFYFPIPDTRALTCDILERRSALPGIRIDDESQIALVADCASTYGCEYRSFSTVPEPSTSRFHFGNKSIETVDAEMLYCMVRRFKPERIIEIGSGFSTLLIVDALSVNKREGRPGHLTAIEPYPCDFLGSALRDVGELIVQPVQQVALHEFTSLNANDIVFIDSSHVCKIGSDVQYEYLEILPRLKPGVIVHLHDIFLPAEYPRNWVIDHHRFWNEQYLLQALLCGNDSFEVLFAGSYMHLKHSRHLSAAFPSYDEASGWPASFWIRKTK